MYLPYPELFGAMNTRSKTELVFCLLSANLVGPGLEGGGSSSPRLSAMVSRSSVWIEWY